jgi:hypothetical protein
MSKPSLNSLTVARKGHAVPASTVGDPESPNEPREEVTKEASKEGEKVARKQSTKPATKEVKEAPARRRPWDGQDDDIKANYEVPRRVQTKLHSLKAWGKVKNIKGFVATALEAAIDREIAKAEREGF